MSRTKLSILRSMPLITALALAGLTGCAHSPQPPQDSVTTKAVVVFESCAKPVYPDEDFRAGRSGTVTLGFLVGVDGKAKEAKIVKSSGFGGLDEAARVAIFKCQFKPATKDGVPVDSWANIQYVWALS